MKSIRVGIATISADLTTFRRHKPFDWLRFAYRANVSCCVCLMILAVVMAVTGSSVPHGDVSAGSIGFRCACMAMACLWMAAWAEAVRSR